MGDLPESPNGTGLFTSAEVAETAGVPVERVKRLWRALGFADAGGEAIFTETDVEALQTVATVLSTGAVDEDLAVNLARGVGLSMARLAEWEVSALVHRFDEDNPEPIADGDTVRQRADQFASWFNPVFEELMLYAWRRHIGHAMGRLDAADEANTVEVTVGFADIVAFTALSNTLTEEKIGDLVEVFEARCADVVALHHGRVIKSLGDSVLFINEDPIQAIDTAEGIISLIGGDARMPDVRVGIATGSVVLRMGDVFGPPVNLAARLTAVARRNRIIIDEPTAALLPEDQFETRRLPARPVRGFGVLEPLVVMRH